MIRDYIFSIVDFISGNKIKAHIDDCQKVIFESTPIEKKIKVDLKIKSILEHAKKNVNFYSDESFKNLEDFPVVDKNIIKSNFNSFIAVNYRKKKIFKAVTSGSTGTPFTVLQDLNKKHRNTADTIFFSELVNFKLGTKLNYMKIWTSVNKKSKLIQKIQNINPIDVTNLGKDDLDMLVKNISKAKSKQAFLSYASALESICQHIERYYSNLKIPNVTAVIAMSEALNAGAAEKISKYFGVIPISRYSNVENGILAQQTLSSEKKFLVNSASYYIEVLEFDSNKVVSTGEFGRIVITDLYNYAMPIIRYDTGDIGCIELDNEGNNLFLTKIEGRKMDAVFDTKGNLVSSFTITNNMWFFPEIQQYQFVQIDIKTYQFILNIFNEFTREEELVTMFKSFFGQDANISVKYVKEIPLLNSGKRRKVINLLYK